MKLVVAVKQVPDTEAVIRISSDRTGIEKEGIVTILNPYDEFAVEEALRLREAQGGEVWALTVGPDSAVEVLRTAIAMGVDDAVHIRTDDELDALATAELLARQIETMGADLTLFGKQAIDDGYGVVGTMVAEMLGIPVVTLVSSLRIEGGVLQAERDIEGGREVVETSLPAVITAQKGLNEPRYPSLRGKMMAKRKEIQTVEAGETKTRLTVTGMSYPPGRSATKILGEGLDGVPELLRIMREELKLI